MEKARIGDVLVEKWRINRVQIKDAILYKLDQKKVKNRIVFLGEALIELGHIEARELMFMMEEMWIRLKVGEILVKNERLSYKKLHEILEEHIGGLFLEELVNRFLIKQIDLNDTLSEQVSHDMTPDAFHALFWKFLETPKEEKKPLTYSRRPKPPERSWQNDSEMYIPDSVRMNDM